MPRAAAHRCPLPMLHVKPQIASHHGLNCPLVGLRSKPLSPMLQGVRGGLHQCSGADTGPQQANGGLRGHRQEPSQAASQACLGLHGTAAVLADSSRLPGGEATSRVFGIFTQEGWGALAEVLKLGTCTTYPVISLECSSFRHFSALIKQREGLMLV